MSHDKLAEQALEERKRVAVENGLAVARVLRQNVGKIQEALFEDAAVVDAVGAKLEENRDRVEREADALARTLRQVILGSRQRRRMFGFMFLVITATGILCRLT
ncbi:hypothetical protein GMRT_15625 [Giardia muris]|uniref:Uncharacterized protein n=1 Tax=Giardia muris TaxID=5742 RepID=A0A4Z1SSC6_GIAMU|nr:hypothetical protein GMRT_15625 [Giardia muris]|eukprot:TNJ28784.1 hypothetical protein GMRT_15625 [Giardia muris]